MPDSRAWSATAVHCKSRKLKGEGMRYTSVLMISTLALIACEPEVQSMDRMPPPGGSMPVPEVRDSAGVRIVEYGSLHGIDLTSWHLVMDDTVRIGRADGPDEPHDSPYLFGRPVGVARLASGSVAVADAFSTQVRLFNANGSFQQSIGRRGQGPGEFTTITGVHAIRGDSLVVVEHHRWSVFDEAGAHVRSGQLPAEGIVFPDIVAVFEDGTLLADHRRRYAEAPPLLGGNEMRGTTDYSRFGSDGSFISSFGTFPQPIILMVVTEAPPVVGAAASAISLQPLPSAFRPTVEGTRLFWPAAGYSEVQVFDSEDDARMILRFSGTPPGGEPRATACPGSLRFPEDMSREVMARFCEIRRELGEPTFSALVVDDLGNLWLREPRSDPDAPDQRRRWYVFDPDGMVVAAVSLPSAWGVGPLRIGRDHLLARERDDFGVETFVLVPLAKR